MLLFDVDDLIISKIIMKMVKLVKSVCKVCKIALFTLISPKPNCKMACGRNVKNVKIPL